MNPLANELNEILKSANPHIYDMLAEIGKNLFFPKGILSQSAEAKQKGHKINATIGIATEKGRTMHFGSIMNPIDGIPPEEALTYAPSYGIPKLRKKWQAELFVKNPGLGSRTISLPVVACGITHALSVFGDVWVDPGDVIVAPEMMWGNYNMIFQVRKGARFEHYQIFSENNQFNIDGFKNALEKAATDNNKVIVLLNFPHNPSGYTATQNEADEIYRVVTAIAEKGTNVVVVLDDAYFGLFYEEETMKESLFARFDNAHERILAVKLDGATKENFVWGLRVGFITYGAVLSGNHEAVYDALERKTAGCVRGSISNASHLGQSIVLKSMESDAYLAEKQEKFNVLKSRAYRVKEVASLPKYKDAWDVYPFNSGYFMCIQLKDTAAEQLRVHLLDKYGVGLIALGKHNLRVALSCLEEADIPDLFDIVLQGVNDLKET